jgi:TonB-linked SusC/RagA family outer membrane protein
MVSFKIWRKITGNYFVACNLLLFLLSIVFVENSKAQVNTKDFNLVKGVVLSQNVPISGVTVYLFSDSLVRTKTDENGNFEINNASNNDKLTFVSIGFRKEIVSIDKKKYLIVELIPSEQEVDEVVVVAYGTQKKETLVGAVSSVSVKDLKVPTRSLNNALAGRVSGITAVQRSGEPGRDDAQFWIRGVSTFGAGSNPLIIVDGVERPLSNIEPEEIASFSILKDASATAVYGIRGANGVVLVNTKKGNTESLKINVKAENGYNSPTRLPKLADAVLMYELYNEANLNMNPDFITPYTSEIIDLYRNQTDPELYPNINWIDFLMKDQASNGRVNLNIIGGGSTAKYFVSGTYYSESGIWKQDDLNKYNTNTNLKRYNFRSNVDIKLGATTDLGIGLGGILVNQNFPGRSSSEIWNFILKANPGDYQPFYINPLTGERVFGGSGNQAIRNPYHDLVNTGYQTTWNNSLQSNLTLNQNLKGILEGLRAVGMFSFDAYNYHNIQRTRDWGDMYRAIGRDSEGNLILNKYYDGSENLGFNRQSSGNRRIYIQANLVYDRTFGDHTFGGLLLYNQQDYVNAEASTSIGALPYRLQGGVVKLSYSYKSKYLLEANAGYNGSENFKKGSRFGLFPSLGLGYILSEEKFFEPIKDWISLFKIRATIGLKGNDQIGGRRFAFLTTTGGGNGNYAFGVDGGLSYNGIGEDEWGVDLTWEKEKEINLGLDLRLFNRLGITVDAYSRNRDGIFLQRSSMPSIVGIIKNPWGNIGKMDNKGVDVSVDYRQNINDFDISFRGNFTYTKNTILDNDQAYSDYKYLSQIGRRYYQPFGLIADGLYTDSDFIDLNNYVLQPYNSTPKFGSTVKPGDIKYRDVNNDGLINSNDFVPIGNPNFPDIIYGFGTSMGYKGVDLSIFFQGSQNMDFMLGGYGVYPFLESLGRASLMDYAVDRWTQSNPSQDVIFPRLSYGNHPHNYQPSTWWQKDASYIRLKSVELGYTFSDRITKALRVKGLRLYASGINLYTWSTFKFWDPELGSGNGGVYPIQKNFNFGVNIQL